MPDEPAPGGIPIYDPSAYGHVRSDEGFEVANAPFSLSAPQIESVPAVPVVPSNVPLPAELQANALATDVNPAFFDDGTNDVHPSVPGSRLAFSRTNADGNEEYIPTSLHPSGSTIPDSYVLEEGGRSWQAYRAGSYYLPNDAVEQDRLDLNQISFGILLDGATHKAPIEKPARVLDIGTGTGIWAIDFAERNPESQVIGVDLSLIQPDVSARVSNVQFFREDVEDDWLFNEPFDLIHQRLMFSCCNDHRALAKKMFDNLKPGGWAEYQDTTFAITSDDGSHIGTTFHQWTCLAVAGAAAKGRDLDVTRKYKEFLLEAGFVDVVELKSRWWGNPWMEGERNQTLGKYGLISGMEVCRAISPKLLQEGLGMSAEETEELTLKAETDMRNPDMHWYWPFYVVYGRKPFPGEVTPSSVDNIKISKSVINRL